MIAINRDDIIDYTDYTPYYESQSYEITDVSNIDASVLHTFVGSTIFSNSADAEMSLSYATATQEYIDDEIDSLPNSRYNLIFGYSKYDSTYPKFSFTSSGINVYVDGYIAFKDYVKSKTSTIDTYNSSPTTFSIGENQSLVFDISDSTCKVVNSINSKNHLILVSLNSNKVISGGEWIPYLVHQTSVVNFREPPIPYSPRSITKVKTNNVGDQSMCIIGEWIFCINAEDSDGYIRILNKDSYELIKRMSHTIGHGGDLSYNAENDTLVASQSSVTYFFKGITTLVNSQDTLSPSDASVTCDEKIGVIGETGDVSYSMVMTGTIDTLANYKIYKYSLGLDDDGDYDGTYTLTATYTANYRIGQAQDATFYGGFLYKAIGYKDAVVYKIAFNSKNKFEIVESYNVPNASTLEAEGLVVDKDRVILSAREYNDTTAKYRIVMNRF